MSTLCSFCKTPRQGEWVWNSTAGKLPPHICETCVALAVKDFTRQRRKDHTLPKLKVA